MRLVDLLIQPNKSHSTHSNYLYIVIQMILNLLIPLLHIFHDVLFKPTLSFVMIQGEEVFIIKLNKYIICWRQILILAVLVLEGHG